MRKTLCALVLVLSLFSSALAGDINNPPLTAPGDISSPRNASQSADARILVIPTDAEASATTADVLVETTLIVIDGVLALL